METNAIATTASSSALQVMPTASGHTILLSNEEFPIYHLHITRFLTEYRPENARESELVQRLADTEWRINRISRLEMGIFAHGHIEFANLFTTEDANVRTLLIEQHTMFTYARQLNSLGLQESRLRRYFNEDRAELLKLQADRKDLPKEKTAAATATSTHGSSHHITKTTPILQSINGSAVTNSFDLSKSEAGVSTRLHREPNRQRVS